MKFNLIRRTTYEHIDTQTNNKSSAYGYGHAASDRVVIKQPAVCAGGR